MNISLTSFIILKHSNATYFCCISDMTKSFYVSSGLALKQCICGDFNLEEQSRSVTLLG